MEEEEEKKTLPRASFHFSGHLLCRQIASANSFSTPGKEMSVELLPEKRRERGREGRKAPPLRIWPDKMCCNHLHPDNYNPILLFILLWNAVLRPLSGCSVIPSYVYPFGNLNDIRIVTLSANFVATRWHMIRLAELYFPTHDKQTRVTAVYSSIMRCCGVGVRTKPSCASKINNKKKFLCSDLAANNLHQNTFFLCSFPTSCCQKHF